MSKEVMQQALNALEFVNKSDDDFMNFECSALVLDAINALEKSINLEENSVFLNDENVIAYCLKRGIEPAKNLSLQQNENNRLHRQNAVLLREKLKFEAEAKEWFDKFQEEAEERKNLYELNGILLQKCHTLEKMVEYKVDHLFDAPTNNRYVLTGYLKTLVCIDENGMETYIDEPFYTIAKEEK